MKQHQPSHMHPWVEPMRARRRQARRNLAIRSLAFCTAVPAWYVALRWLDKIL